MIDKSRKYWYGDCANDIDEFLREYTEISDLEIKPVTCHSCNSNTLIMRIDSDEEAIQIQCPKCGEKKILLDCQDIWDEVKPKLRRCVVCKISKKHNIKVGFVRRENGDVKWVYIGSRCTNCGVLASYLDWHINYGPTCEMEKNI